MEGLQQTSDLLSKELPVQIKEGSIYISKHVIDLADINHLEQGIQTIFQQVDDHASDLILDKAILVNNAGSLGTLGPSYNSNLMDMKRAIDFNVTSSCWLSSYFIRYFCKERRNENETNGRPPPNCLVVNMSSLCGIQPFKTMGVYCAGKAARDMFHSVLAQEEEGGGVEEDDKDWERRVKIVNYAPGPVESEMTHELSESTELDSELKEYFTSSLEGKTLIQPMTTASKLVELVMEGTFKSGQHVDFYDLEESNV